MSNISDNGISKNNGIPKNNGISSTEGGPAAGDTPVAAGTDSLIASAKAASKKGPPPVHLWNPPFCGDLDMRIARDGTWFYLGTPIGRPELVKLFASILRKDDDKYVLVTPVEMVGITVDDAPFVAVDFDIEGQGADQTLVFTTNVGDVVRAGPEHAIRVSADPVTLEPSPYLHVRRGLEALIDRKSFYRLAELGEDTETKDGPVTAVRSGGETFAIGPPSSDGVL